MAGGCMAVSPEFSIADLGHARELELPLASALLSHENLADRKPSNSAPEFLDLFQQVINGLDEQIALVDDHWNILAVNDAWVRTAADYGYSELQPGTNYLDFCHARADEGHSAAGLAAAGIVDMDATGKDYFHFLYEGSDRWEGHAFKLCINRLSFAGRTFGTVTRYDVTELINLRRLREGFSHTLIEGQAEERRRIARELHDSTMQLLVGLSLAVGQLKRSRKPKATLDIVAEMESLLGEAQQEIRSISYLAHPPLLRDMGLGQALEALVEGFSKRTGLRLSLHLDPELRISWRSAEVALYRIAQEALSNIHRHAHATDGTIGLYVRKSMIHIVVVDNGIGMPPHVRHGVGLPSMRARVAELGGRMRMRPASPGTILIASLPKGPGFSATGDLSFGK